MPNLNLKGDAGKPTGKPVSEAPSMHSSGGGAMKTIVILLFAVLIVGGGVFFLNKAGIIKLWGKKPVPQAAATQIEFADTLAAPEPADTTGLVQFSDKEKTKAPPAQAKGKQEKKQPPAKKVVPVPPAKQTASQQHAAMGSGPFSIQLSSWASREKAEMEVDVLKKKGHPAFVQEGFVSGMGRRFRVNVGRFPSEAAAQESAKKLIEQTSGGYLIVRMGN
jgi:cell division septation protein DedD